jgi:hypothetical protein
MNCWEDADLPDAKFKVMRLWRRLFAAAGPAQAYAFAFRRRKPVFIFSQSGRNPWSFVSVFERDAIPESRHSSVCWEAAITAGS